MDILILGSAPDVMRCEAWDLGAMDAIVAINNAWRVRPDWTAAIYPDDFPEDRRPVAGPGQRVVTSHAYVPAVNTMGGIVYCGATMAFCAAYWALAAMAPARMFFLGCDMIYDRPGHTHFYGTGTPDPLRPDPTLQSLEAKGWRFRALAAMQGCAVFTLAAGPSRLPFPRAAGVDAPDLAPPLLPDPAAVAAALAAEAALDAFVPSGRYWEAAMPEAARLAEVDALWSRVFPLHADFGLRAAPALMPRGA